MNEPWVIYGFVFGATLFAVLAVYWLVFRFRATQKSINRRLELHKQLSSRTAALEVLRRERGLADFKNPILRRMSESLTQAGLRLDGNLVAVSMFALSGGLFFLFSLVFGYGILSLFGAIGSTLGLMFAFVSTARRKRIARFAEQLPDAIDVVVRGTRVGHPLSVAIELVAREMPDPVGTEFGITTDEIAFGLDVGAAVGNLYRRVGQEDLLFLIISITVQQQTGGNLAEILSRLSRLIRSRAKVHLKIRSLTAEGRISARVLSVMPFLLFAVINLINQSYFGDILGHPMVTPALIYAALSLAVGNIMIYRMAHFKF